MKSYYAPQQLCLVGKAWEVQYYLRKLVSKSPRMGQPLSSLLQERGGCLPKSSTIPFKIVSLREE